MAATQGSNLGIYHSWTLGETPWNVENDDSLKLLDAMVLIEVLSATVVAEPGSPAAGDRYIVPTGATGTDWAGQDGTVALFDGTLWQFFTPKEGWEIRADDTKQAWVFDAAAWALEGSLYGQFADDATAGAGLVPIGGIYVNSGSGSLQVRLI